MSVAIDTSGELSQAIVHAAAAMLAAPMPGVLMEIRQAHRLFSLQLALADRDGRLTRNVAAGVRLTHAGRADRVFLTHAQVAELAAAASHTG